MARDRLAKQLRASGDRDAAAAVKKLRRPTVVAWALNQVARTHGAAIEELAEVTSAVERSQAAAVGSGDPGGLREASQRRRQLIASLARAAADLAGPAHHDRAAATIDAASLDPDLAPLLRRGRLTKELSAPAGFGRGDMPERGPSARSVPSTRAVPDPPSPAPQIDLERLRREVERAEAAVVGAEEKLAQAAERLLRAQADVEAAQSQLDQAVGERGRVRAVEAGIAPA